MDVETSAAFDALNHYINYAEMFIPTTNYWNIIHGTTPGEVYEDEEGVQIMRVLGKNMAFLMKSLEASSAGETLLPFKIQSFHEKYPCVDFHLREGGTFEILELIKTGVVEIGVIRTPLIRMSLNLLTC